MFDYLLSGRGPLGKEPDVHLDEHQIIRGTHSVFFSRHSDKYLVNPITTHPSNLNFIVNPQISFYLLINE